MAHVRCGWVPDTGALLPTFPAQRRPAHRASLQRPAWFPYFDDCDAIIFLAPISCFDERLAEDRKVNRLEDSYMLWRLVCASKLLQNTQMILFLNKYDLLDQKLRRGVRVKDHVRSYGDRPNDVETVSKCECC